MWKLNLSDFIQRVFVHLFLVSLLGASAIWHHYPVVRTHKRCVISAILKPIVLEVALLADQYHAFAFPDTNSEADNINQLLTLNKQLTTKLSCSNVVFNQLMF